MLILLAEAALRSLCLALLLAGVLRLARAHNPYVVRMVWCAVLLAALLMPALMYLSRTPAAALIAVPQSSVVRMPALAQSHWQQLALIGVYWLGCSVLMLRQGLATARAFALRRTAARISADWAGPFDVRICPDLPAPVTLGTTILLPASYLDWTPRQRQGVIAHEGTHVRHGDFLWLSLAHLHRAVFWFNPLAWWLPRRLAVLGEHLSDDAALTAMSDRGDYANLLLAFAGRNPPPVGIAMARAGSVGARIERILSQRSVASRPGASVRATLVLAVLATTLLVAACDRRAGTQVTPPQPEGIDREPRSIPGKPLSEAVYPAESRLRGEQGRVILQLHVLTDGRVDGVQVKDSSGFAQLDIAAAKEALGWTLDPAIVAGKPVAAWGEFAVAFKLTD